MPINFMKDPSSAGGLAGVGEGLLCGNRNPPKGGHDDGCT
jgi:hypothetical protein